MLEIKIRLDDTLLSAVDAHARAAGQSREGWMRQALAQSTDAPVLRGNYHYRGYAENGAFAHIARDAMSPLHARCAFQNATQEQADACRRAQLLVIANEPGDLQEALALLASAGFRMIETAK